MNLYEWEYNVYKKMKNKKCKNVYLTFLFLMLAISLAILFKNYFVVEPESKKIEEPEVNEIYFFNTEKIKEEENFDFVKKEKIYYDLPFDNKMQNLVRMAAEETGIDFKLALSVIWKETNFQNVMGDNGNSYGYMQIQKKWHKDRMDRLGVTDLMDPLSNFRVGCDYLSELLENYPIENALSFYNSGKPNLNSYCEDVMDYMDRIEEKTSE